MTILKFAFPLLAIYLILISAVSLSKSQRWWIRIYDYPRVQIAVMSMLVAALAFIPGLRNPFNLVLAALLAGAVAFQCAFILPYTPLWRKQTKDARNRAGAGVFSLMVSNVRMQNRNYDKLLCCVSDHDPDIVLLMETDQDWARALTQLNERYPYSILQPKSDLFGIMFFSRLPLQDSRIVFLREDHIPSIHTGIRLNNDVMIMFHGLHPEAPVPGIDTDGRDAEILQIGRWVADSNAPAIVAGDLNDVAWSHTSRLFSRISRTSDPRIGRGFYNTYNAFIPFFRYPLDYIFHTPHFRLVKLKRLPAIGSDHFPMMIVLSYEPDPENMRDVPHADHSDHKEVEEKTMNSEQ